MVTFRRLTFNRAGAFVVGQRVRITAGTWVGFYATITREEYQATNGLRFCDLIIGDAAMGDLKVSLVVGVLSPVSEVPK